MRVGIVNDLSVAVAVLTSVVRDRLGWQVAWVAADGREAVEKVVEDSPDLVLMDLIMPNLDGAEATREIMESRPVPILVVTASVEGNRDLVFRALAYGAEDAVKLTEETHVDSELIIKIKRMMQQRDAAEKRLQIQVATPPKEGTPPVLIGASSGGPGALERLFKLLPSSFSSPIIVVQHLDSGFMEDFVRWLGRSTSLPVEVAAPNTTPKPGHIYLAGGGRHLIFDEDLSLQYSPDEPSLYVPSVDKLFESAAMVGVPIGTAILLTGMGSDGVGGLRILAENGWHTIGQSGHDCRVWGMSKVAFERGYVKEMLTIAEMGRYLAKGAAV